MLIKNAQNLMKVVINTVRAAEAACMKVSVCEWVVGWWVWFSLHKALHKLLQGI